MTPSVKSITQTWIDDHLDLYNFAKQMGDRQWQEQLLLILTNKELHIQHEVQRQMKQALWRQFDSVNKKMLELFAQLRRSNSAVEVDALREKVWELKYQRIAISRKIKSH